MLYLCSSLSRYIKYYILCTLIIVFQKSRKACCKWCRNWNKYRVILTWSKSKLVSMLECVRSRDWQICFSLLTAAVNFINFLRAAFMRNYPKWAKKTDKSSVSFCTFGICASAKAARKMLVKFTPGGKRSYLMTKMSLCRLRTWPSRSLFEAEWYSHNLHEKLFIFNVEALICIKFVKSSKCLFNILWGNKIASVLCL